MADQKVVDLLEDLQKAGARVHEGVSTQHPEGTHAISKSTLDNLRAATAGGASPAARPKGSFKAWVDIAF
jgi:hypothetical protein